MTTDNRFFPTREDSSTLTIPTHQWPSSMLPRDTAGPLDPGSTSGRANGSVPVPTPKI